MTKFNIENGWSSPLRIEALCTNQVFLHTDIVSFIMNDICWLCLVCHINLQNYAVLYYHIATLAAHRLPPLIEVCHYMSTFGAKCHSIFNSIIPFDLSVLVKYSTRYIFPVKYIEFEC